LYLVDTSVWIGFMRDEENEATGRLAEIGVRGHPFGITGVIHQEVLQGAASKAKFDYLAAYLGSQTFYHPVDPVESYREAAFIYFRCRRAGVTIRSAIDCLIARVAIEHGLMLLHDDRDFEKIAEIIPDLTLA
jgi:predicted nucleic acid-binding protein